MTDRRRLSLFDLLCLGVNAIVGSGIYAFPGILAQMLGPASPLAFAGCGGVALVVGLCFAEAAGRFDRSGGPYVYAGAAFHPWIAFLVGWSCWSAAVLSWAAVTRFLLGYLGGVWQPLDTVWVGIAVIAGLAAINVIGVKAGAITTNLLTAAKLAPLGLLVVAGLRRFDPRRLSPFAPHGLAPLPRAMFIAFFAYQGFEVVPVPAGETRDPRRSAPLAVVGAVLGATLLYVVVQLVAVATTPDLAGSGDPLARMATAVLGSAGGRVVSWAASISMLGFCAGVALGGPRYLEALAADGFLPRRLGHASSRFGTPAAAIAATAVVTAALVLLFDVGRLVDLSVVTVGVQYLATAAAVIALRGRDDLPRGFRLPLGPLVPLAAIAIVIVLTVSGLRQQADWPRVLGTFGAIVAGGCLLPLAGALVRRLLAHR